MSSRLETLKFLEDKFYQLHAILEIFRKEWCKTSYTAHLQNINKLETYLDLLIGKTFGENSKTVLVAGHKVVVKPFDESIDKTLAAEFFWNQLIQKRPENIEQCYKIPDLKEIYKPNVTTETLISKRQEALSIISEIKPMLP